MDHGKHQDVQLASSDSVNASAAEAAQQFRLESQIPEGEDTAAPAKSGDSASAAALPSLDLHGNKTEVHTEKEMALWKTFQKLETGDSIRIHKDGKSADIYLKDAGTIRVRNGEVQSSTSPISSYTRADGTGVLNVKDSDVTIEIKNGKVANLTRDGKKLNFVYK